MYYFRDKVEIELQRLVDDLNLLNVQSGLYTYCVSLEE